MEEDIIVHQQLYNTMILNKKSHRLDHLWTIRSHLNNDKCSYNEDAITTALITESIKSYKYFDINNILIENDSHLHSICKKCTSEDSYDVDYQEGEVTELSFLFNILFNSNRNIYACYDCGTVSRWVFFKLIKSYRKDFILNIDEFKRIRNDYFYMHSDVTDMLNDLLKKDKEVNKPMLFLFSLQLGENTGHIFLIEKSNHPTKNTFRYRIYQSCLNSYMLMDIVEYYDYANPDATINFDEYINDMNILFSNKNWDNDSMNIFYKWYHYDLHETTIMSSIKNMSGTYIIL